MIKTCAPCISSHKCGTACPTLQSSRQVQTKSVPLQVGIVTESSPGERRVAMVPAAIGVLNKSAVELVMQSGAGAAAGFPDSEYTAKGVRIASRDEVPIPKPDPALYLYCAASLSVEPEDCLAVEDSPPGLESALLAHIPSAAVLTTFPRPAVESPVPGRPDLKPIWIGPSVTQVFEWLKSLA